jgi:hypothetical protein
MVSTFPSNAVAVFEAIAASGADGHDHARVHGALGYANPSEGLHDPKLSMGQKRNVLRQWAFDAYRMEVAATEGIRPSAPSGLDEAIDALIDLDGGVAPVAKPSSVRPAEPGARAQAA